MASNLPRPLADGTVQSCNKGCRALCAAGGCRQQATRVLELEGRRYSMCDAHPTHPVPGVQWVLVLGEGVH